jgi:acetyl-CoA acyltransferase 1
MAFVQKGIKNILQKNPNDVVILSALRTPVTRAKKGGLRDAYDHELLGAVSLCECVRQLDLTCR